MKKRARSGNNHRSESVCAACRYQRKRCPPDCPLAPYFPPSRENDFRDVRRLFGISNILKLIANLDPPHKHIAMKSIIFHAKKRALDPVGGCHRIILQLQLLIQSYTSQLHLVLQKLHQCRQQGAAYALNMPLSMSDGESQCLELCRSSILAPRPHDLQQHIGGGGGVSLSCNAFQPVEEQHICLLANLCPGVDDYNIYDGWPVKLEANETTATSSTQCLLQTLLQAACNLNVSDKKLEAAVCNLDVFDKKIEATEVLDNTKIVQHRYVSKRAQFVVITSFLIMIKKMNLACIEVVMWI